MSGAAPADENVLVLPERLRESLHPRRGGVPGPPVEIDGAAAEVLGRRVERKRDRIEKALADPGADSRMVERARRHLDGEPDPIGAAAIAEAVCSVQQDRSQGERSFVDGWIAGHGLAFAACALAELCDITARSGLHSFGDGSHGGETGEPWGRMPDRTVARRLRALLAAADDQAYADAVDRLAASRRTPTQRLVAAYLVPTRQDWVDECCASLPPERFRPLLLTALSTPRHLDLLGDRARLDRDDCGKGVFVTMADGLGTAVIPLLTRALEPYPAGVVPTGHEEVLDVLGAIPVDEAFASMVARIVMQPVQAALPEVMERFPARAVRLLAPASAGTSRGALIAADMLEAHLRAHPELAAADDLPARAKAVAAAAARVPDAPAEALPPLLADPPWIRERAPVVVKGLKAPAEQSVRWGRGERDAWAGAEAWPMQPPKPGADLRGLADSFRKGGLNFRREVGLLAEGPDDLVRPLLAVWAEGAPLTYSGDWWRPLAARFGLEMLPVVLKSAAKVPAAQDDRLLPFLDAGVATLMAACLAAPKAARPAALAWFDRHGLDAVPLLVPAAVGTAARRRRDAETALRLLAGGAGTDGGTEEPRGGESGAGESGAGASAVRAHGAAAVVEAARVHGDAAAGAVEALLSADPLEVLAGRPPKIGAWADPEGLPQVLLSGRGAALPAAATGHFLAMLAISKPEGEPYPGVARVREACDRESLAGFAWAVFLRWQRHGAPPEDGWALGALGLLGDDETVRRLSPLIRAWPGENGYAKAVRGVAVLAAIGSEVALMHLNGIARNVKFEALRWEARQKVKEIAEGLGLTAGQLDDRLFPDLGLDAGGGLTLDYGPRRFVVGFDEALKPYVADEDGERRKTLPKPGAKDDAELAPAAYQRFATLKKDVRVLASDRLPALETAMLTRREWAPAEFRRFVVGHPLVCHIARRLVWLSEDGGRATAFRVAEDRTFADVDDEAYVLPDTARVSIPHPLHLGDVTAVWAEVFADYEILQPFPQLGRPVHALTEVERATGRLERFEGVRVPAGGVRGLAHRGWGLEQNDYYGGVQDEVSRSLPDRRYIQVALEPGLDHGRRDEDVDQVLSRVSVVDPGENPPQGAGEGAGRRADGSGAAPEPGGAGIALSEALADLVRLTAATAGTGGP